MHRRVRNKHDCRERSVALLLALIAVAISATLALSFLSAQSTSIGIARNIHDHPPARYVAESGLALAIAHVQSNATWRTDRPNGTWVTDESFAGGTFTIVGVDGEDTDGDGVVDGDGDLADDPGDPLTLTATGVVDSAGHVVRAVLTPGTGSGTVYDYANRTQGTDIFAYSDASTTRIPTDAVTPGGPSTVLNASEYDDIEVLDADFFIHSISSNNYYVRQRFEIHFDEDEASITRIDISWTGKGVNENPMATDGAKLYIWKYSGAGGSTYDLLVTGADTESTVTLTGSVTSDIPDYIGPGTTISLLAVTADKAKGAPNENILYTDYLSVAINSGAAGFTVAWSE